MTTRDKLPPIVGDIAARSALARMAGSFADATALGAKNGAKQGQVAITQDGGVWLWDTASVLTADGVLVAGAATAGRWLRAPNQLVDLAIPFTFAQADASALYTVPTGAAIKLVDAWWEVTTDFTGGTASAIGLSSDNTDLNTQGDILGGATGDVLAGLVAGEFQGTTGAIDLATNPIAGLIAAEILRFDRITSAFTAGVGVAHVIAHITKNPGA